jgi:hypothetical protein
VDAARTNVEEWRSAPGPLVIGGTGGSGTRLVMRLVRRAGWFMGTNLNSFGDALDLGCFDWRWGRHYVHARASKGAPVARMAVDHHEAVRRHLQSLGDSPVPWGWKHPHSYLMLPFLREMHPGLRFIHVVRDGRDMAFSPNQRQALRYGPVALGARWVGPNAVRSAAYWAWANTLALEDGEAELGEHYLCLRFEDFCTEQEATVRRLLAFADCGEPDADLIRASVAEISMPSSAGRWQSADAGLRAAVVDAARPALRRFGYIGD